jgi:hypothetical protein
VDAAWPDACAAHFGTLSAGAGEARFYVQSDSIEAFRSMADGRFYTSKSRYRSDLKARGLIEVGNDAQSKAPKPREVSVDRGQLRQTIRDTYRQLGG